jgi:hypothetical protein
LPREKKPNFQNPNLSETKKPRRTLKAGEATTSEVLEDNPAEDDRAEEGGTPDEGLITKTASLSAESDEQDLSKGRQ